MILEYAQLISTALRMQGYDIGYKKTHINHPCSKWARKSKSNLLFLFDLIKHLNEEYRYRYEKLWDHKAYDKVRDLRHWTRNMKDVGLTPFPQAMPDQYKSDNPILAYRDYYIGEKRHIAKWTRRPIPCWWK